MLDDLSPTEIRDRAEYAAGWLTSCGYRADFKPQSLSEVDRFFDDQVDFDLALHRGRPHPAGLLAEHYGEKVLSIGCYVGEVLHGHLGGAWGSQDDVTSFEHAPNDASGLAVPLVLGDGKVIWPLERVAKRIVNGPEDGIAGYAAVLGLDVGSRSKPPASGLRRLFRRI